MPRRRRVPDYKARRQQRERRARQKGGLAITAVWIDELLGAPRRFRIGAAVKPRTAD